MIARAAADQRRLDHSPDGLPDVSRLVRDERELELRVDLAEVRLQGRHDVQDTAGHGHGVRAALLVDRDLDTLLAVDAGDHLAFAAAPVDPGYVPQTHDGALGAVDDDLAHFLGPQQFVDRPHQVFGLAVAQPATGQIHVLLGQPVHDLVHRQADVGQPPFVDVDLDLLFETAADDNRRDTFEPLDPAAQILFRKQPQADQVAALAAGQPQADDRIERRVIPQQDRLLGVRRQPDLIEPLPNVQRREVHVRAPGKLERHLAGVRAGAGDHAVHTVHHTHRILDRARDQGLDLGRRRTLVLGPHGHRRVGDVRQQVDRQVPERDAAEHDRGHGEDEHRDRPPGGERDDPHEALLLLRPASALGPRRRLTG